MSELELLNEIIEGRHTATVEEARMLLDKWPACILPAVSALAANPDGAEADALRRRIALAVGDPRGAMRVLGDEGERFDNFYPDPRHTVHSTVDTIDAFLGRFASSSPAPEAIEESLFNGSETAEQQLPTEPENALAPAPAPEPQPLEITAENAELMLRQRNYTAALEIIQALSLNNPEKSIYFADQIRFLRKLIINDNNKQ